MYKMGHCANTNRFTMNIFFSNMSMYPSYKEIFFIKKSICLRLTFFGVIQIYSEIVDDKNNQINSSTQASAEIT